MLDEEEGETDEEGKEEEEATEAAPASSFQTPSDLATPSGMASVVSTIAAGLETPDFHELRKTTRAPVRDESENSVTPLGDPSTYKPGQHSTARLRCYSNETWPTL